MRSRVSTNISDSFIPGHMSRTVGSFNQLILESNFTTVHAGHLGTVLFDYGKSNASKSISGITLGFLEHESVALIGHRNANGVQYFTLHPLGEIGGASGRKAVVATTAVPVPVYLSNGIGELVRVGLIVVSLGLLARQQTLQMLSVDQAMNMDSVEQSIVNRLESITVLDVQT